MQMERVNRSEGFTESREPPNIAVRREPPREDLPLLLGNAIFLSHKKMLGKKKRVPCPISGGRKDHEYTHL